MTVTPSARVLTCIRCRDTGPAAGQRGRHLFAGWRRTPARRRPRTARWTPGGRRARPARRRRRRRPACSVKRGRASSSSVTSARPRRRRRASRDDPDHPGRGLVGHRGDRGVVGVEDHHAGRRNSLRQFGFGRGDGLARAELAEMGGADVEHHPDRRRRDRGQRGDVAGMARRHLQDQVVGVGGRAQHRPRDGPARC